MGKSVSKKKLSRHALQATRIGARSPAQRRDASILQERHQRHRDRRHHQRGRHARRPRSTNCSDRRPTSSTPCWRAKARRGANGSSARWKTGGGDAQAKLTRIFPALKRWFAEERFYGCPFINAVAEHDKDAKQFRNIALRHKKVVLAHIEKLAAEMGAAEPQMLAHQLALLIDGAIVAAMVSRDPA